MSDWKELKAMGYRITSRKFCMASRIDRPDWEQFCKDNNHPIDADWYRRVLSKDKITVSRYTSKKLGNSNHDSVGFVGP